MENRDKMVELKNRNEEKFKIKVEKFNKDELFKFPHFMQKGNYRDLKFIPEYNK